MPEAAKTWEQLRAQGKINDPNVFAGPFGTVDLEKHYPDGSILRWSDRRGWQFYDNPRDLELALRTGRA